MKRAAVALALVATATGSGAALTGCGTVSKDFVTGNDRALGYTWAQQVQIGRESDPQILAQFGAYPNESLEQYVNRIGQKIVAVSHLRSGNPATVGLNRPAVPSDVQNTPVTFRVLDSPIINAMALPGGYIYVTRGLLANLENEAQLAVVLGHEVGHVARQHAARQAYQAQRAQLGLIGAMIAGSVIGGTAGQVANALGQYGGQGLQLLLLKYGRDAEEESDRLGVEYASLAGYDAS
ncbi:MAG: M48 family metalloprotease [Rhodothermales bacterium]|nr:M48 family metalloprotease [Rhodothermales bacterium]